ncbi:AAA family ATPase [Sulfurimonas sp. SAG-AH-194-C20]|nr:AAA family ATPase [Sulfurimonas sp. SAG-AH-194-C20]MDF1878813.1 AAA family ATPase [Sulfurimonas sp. SAG-AH-194-C20]
MIEIKVGSFLRQHIGKIIELCKIDDEVLKNLQDLEFCNRTFGLNSSYSLISMFKDIDSRGIYNRFYKEDHIIHTKAYRICSQFGGNHLIDELNASEYHGKKLLKYFKEKNILNDEFINEEIKFIVSSRENSQSRNITMQASISLNQILYGPPGTGKTYNTINRALKIIDGEVSEDRREAKKRFESLSETGQIEFVTFHQSYGYEEFVEGIKANTLDGSISYDVESGVFKKLCKLAIDENYQITAESIVEKATQNLKDIWFSTTRGIVNVSLKDNGSFEFSNHHNMTRRNVIKSLNIFLNSKSIDEITPDSLVDIGANGHRYTRYLFTKKLYDLYAKESYNDKTYILIIDEINRGNISKIFGELITLIEPSKRIGADEEIRLRLPYSGEEFGVPKNLYIIGTMNTADRSIALMDTALRRRFEFIEMMPNTELLDFEVQGINIKTFVDKINTRVEYLYDRDHTIGHAYFMNLNGESSLEELNAVMRNKIIPLLQEYFYDDFEKIKLVLNAGFIQKSEMRASEIFAFGMDDEYIEEERSVYSIVKDFTHESYLDLCQNR